MNRLVVLLLLCSTTLFAQRKAFKGRIVSDGAVLTGVFVINKNSSVEVKSGAGGIFSMAVKAGDQLAVYSDRTQVREFRVSEDWFADQPFELEVLLNTIELKEVVVDDKITTESLYITDGKEKRYTDAERKERTGNKTANMNLGLNLSVDSFINRINGKRKKLKQNVDTETKTMAITNFNAMYTNEQVTESFAIPADYVGAFVYFAVEDKRCATALKANDQKRAEPLLKELSQEYLNLIAEGE